MAAIDSPFLAEQLQSVYVEVFTCDFCPQIFNNLLDRNSHLMQHFVHEFCQKCNKNLIRIGEHLYVLHAHLTCIKAETQSDQYDGNHSNLPIELVQTTEEFFKDECIKNDFVDESINFNDLVDVQNKLGSFNVEINPNELIEPNPRKQSQNQNPDPNPNPNPNPNQTNTSSSNFLMSTRSSSAIISASSSKRNDIVTDSHLNYSDALSEMAAVQSASESSTKNQLKKSKSWKSAIDYNSQIVKCEIEGCDKVMSRSALTYHMSKHRGDRYECDICQASLSSKSGIRSHLLTHIQKDERLKCETCDQTYATKSGLRKHQKFVHSNEPKRFICTICGEGLRQPYLLKEHMFKHTNEKPYKCAYCEKSFRTKRLRSEHERIHTGVKPYKCMIDDCDRAFAYIIDLKRHKYTHHGIYTKQFPCQICSKIFSENMLLRKHMKSHNRIVQKKVKKGTRPRKTKT